MRKTMNLSVFWHSVEADSLSPDGTNPSARLFREHVRFLSENYTPISVVDFLQIQRDKKLTRSYRKAPVCLGFDDGFKNVLTNALPVLEEFKVPAVFFVIGEILRNPNFVPWYVERKHLIRKAAKKTITYCNTSINLSLQQDRTKLKSLFDASFKGCPSEFDRQKALNDFANLLDVNRPEGADLDEDLKFVEPKDLANLPSSSLLTVASHAM
ncbi:MAG: polysaccharide deacetylase family protein, partial [Acidobacteriota bacterium]